MPFAFPSESAFTFAGIRTLAAPKAFAAWLCTLYRSDWVVYSKPPFGGAGPALRYPGRNTCLAAF